MGVDCADQTGGCFPPESNPSFSQVMIPAREGRMCKEVALSFSFHGGLSKLFLSEAAPTRPICFRMSVGFISLLQQPTLQQLGTAPEDAGRCLKPAFLPPFCSPVRLWGKPAVCSLFLSPTGPGSKSSMGSELLPALCLKAQEKSLEQVEVAPAARGHGKVLLLSPAWALFVTSPWDKQGKSQRFSLLGEDPHSPPCPPINKKVIKGSACSSKWH